MATHRTVMSAFRRKRLALGLDQRAIAQATGVGLATIYRWESGASVPHAKYFPKLAEIFGMTGEEVTYLFAPGEPTAA